MTKVVEKKGMNWFKDILSNQNQINENVEKIQEPTTETTDNNDNNVSSTSDSVQVLETFQDNSDKLSLDLMNSVENILKDRQLLSYKKKALEEQLLSANETINRLNVDLLKKDQLLQEGQKVINDLENKLTSKQMGYDQLIEDYKAYQLSSKMEYEKISNQLETETSKYKKLNDDFTSYQYQNMLTVKKLEEKIRNLEIENQKSLEQYQKIVDEKAKLMETINDFTERMTFSFSTNTSSNSSKQE